MLKVIGNNIYLTRGDTAQLKLSIEGGVQEEFDECILTIKKSTEDETAILQIKLDADSHFYLSPEDTRNLEYGTYFYDVQLSTTTGDVFTVIIPHKFNIMEEVTW